MSSNLIALINLILCILYSFGDLRNLLVILFDAIPDIFGAKSRNFTSFTSPETAEDRACHNHTLEPLTTATAALRPLAQSFRPAKVPAEGTN